MLQQIPPVVKNILLINVLLFLATLVFDKAFNISLEDWLALYHYSSDKFMPMQYITYMFMHGNLMHILFNMFAFWMFGRILESYWGAKRFLIFIFVTGLGSAATYTLYESFNLHRIASAVLEFKQNPNVDLYEQFIDKYVPLSNLNPDFGTRVRELIVQWAANPNNSLYSEEAVGHMEMFIEFKRNIPVVGASGVVFGVLLAFGMLFPNTELMLLFPPIPIKAKYFVGIYGLFELFSGLQNNPTDNVAHFAHLGGMFFGFIFILIWKKNNTRNYY
jgi:membrane associated rhomboid family serine protease